MKHTTPSLYNLEAHEVFARLDTSLEGLSPEEVIKRQEQYGPNALPIHKDSLIKRILEPFLSVFVAVLVVALVLSILENQAVEAIIIAAIVIINALIYYVQQYSVARVLMALRGTDIQLTQVIRAAKAVRIPSNQLTIGDILYIREGMKVPADGRLVEANQIEADEALLTGESLPVHKHAGAVAGEKQVYDQFNMLFSGTYIKTGSGLLAVASIGAQTQLGEISTLTAQADGSRSPIEEKIDTFTKQLIIIILISGALVLALSVWRGIAFEEALRFSLVVIVSAVPEGLPVALGIVLLLSARRMAKIKALVRKVASIETLGAVTMLAVDKTGTITSNVFSLAATYTGHADAADFDAAIRASLNGSAGTGADALDTILFKSLARPQTPKGWRKVKNFSFSQGLRVSGALWKHNDGYELYIKGAPEHVLSHCSNVKDAAQDALTDFTTRGFRTIAFAHKRFENEVEALESKHLHHMHFDGFVGLGDQIRPHIKSAVAEAQRAGIKVVMLTGDHVNTAGFIAGNVGIAADASQVRDSSLLSQGDPEEIRRELEHVRVFGRVLPEHKYALLKATKGYEITAMTGDGVNDIPAMAEADAGIAMGSGTDATRDASDIVLLDNNFRTIVNAIRIGRTALANIRKMVMYVLSTSAGEVLIVLAALLIGVPLPVTAIQILWINLVTDGVAVIPLGLSPAEERQMQLPPADPRAPLLNLRQVIKIMVIAVVMAASVLGIFIANLGKGWEYAQTLTFLALIVAQWTSAICLNYEYKSLWQNITHPNKKLLFAIGVSVMLQLFVFLTPFGAFLQVVPVSLPDALLAIVLPIITMGVAVEMHKTITHTSR